LATSWLAGAETLAAAETRLTDVLAGRSEPKSPAEAGQFAVLCMTGQRDRYADAVRFFRMAFADPAMAANSWVSSRFLADGRVAISWVSYRFLAAEAAVRASFGLGWNPPPPAERVALRRQALDWLTADLTARRATVTTTGRRSTHAVLRGWLSVSFFSPVRHPIGLGLLPQDEREAWQKLWAEVRKLCDETAPEQAPLPRPVEP
jgi:hypothetical protein